MLVEISVESVESNVVNRSRYLSALLASTLVPFPPLVSPPLALPTSISEKSK